MMTEYSVFNTILGKMELKSQDGYLTHCSFVSDDTPIVNNIEHEDFMAQLTSYFNGNLKKFDIPIQPNGSIFQKEVWEALLNIPYGKTITYGTLANQLGDNANPRNVGGANGANPIAIIIPCHRVIGSQMKLTGYAGGIERKKKLLELEGAISQQSLF
ncbi:MAG: methylated-DNA--[protein]-cysteine S-methyltransferase [Chitinophagales bacterium]